mgnify:CR=1 FL=1
MSGVRSRSRAINPSPTAVSCSDPLRRELQRSITFWRALTASPPSAVSAAWESISKIRMVLSLSTERACTDWLPLAETLDCGNSGTTTRLISGILAPQNFDVTLTGDESIQKRPMKRIIEPLSMMGADIRSVRGNDCAPLRICGKPLAGIHYTSKVASAQVKSSILLAGLYADGLTSITEPQVSRNHTELMLKFFPAQSWNQKELPLRSGRQRSFFGNQIDVPGDISSSVYFVAAGLILPNSEVLIKNVGINPTRAGLIKVCEAMGADLTLLNEDHENAEPTADLLVRTSSLRGCVIEGDIIPTLIDELPTIAMMACFAEGTTVIRDAAELKVKESNRIAIMVENLRAMGADVEETGGTAWIIHGGKTAPRLPSSTVTRITASP